MSRTERAAKGAITAALQFALQIALQLLLTPVVLRLAGQDTLGVFAILMQALGYLALVDLGFSVALGRYLAQAHGHDDGGKRFRDILTTGRTFLLVSNLLYAGLILALQIWIDDLFSLGPDLTAEARSGLDVLMWWAVIRTPWMIYSSGLNASQNLAAVNLIATGGNASRLLLSLALLFAGGGLVGLVVANVASEAVTNVISGWYFRHLYPDRKPAWGIPDRGLFREMLQFGLQIFLINVSTRLVLYTDNLVVGYLYGAAATSIYYATQMPAAVGYNLVNRLSDSAGPAINELYAREMQESLRNTFLRLCRYTMLLALPLAAGLVLLNGRMIALWVGSAQYAGEPMTLTLAAFVILIIVSHGTNPFIMATGRIRVLTYLALIEGIANLALSLWLGHLLGLWGVMLATVITHSVGTVYMQGRAMREFAISIREYAAHCISPVVVPVTAGFLGAYVITTALPSAGWLPLLAITTAFTLIYIGLAYKFALDKAERTGIGKLLLRAVGRVA